MSDDNPEAAPISTTDEVRVNRLLDAYLRNDEEAKANALLPIILDGETALAKTVTLLALTAAKFMVRADGEASAIAYTQEELSRLLGTYEDPNERNK